MSKRLVVNADDFGFTHDVNAGIVHAHREGVLTATTLMANGAAFDDAVRLARETATLDIGCHLVLVQGNSLLTGRPLPETVRQLLIALSRKQLDIYAELRAQIERIVATRLRPTHLDSHKHTHIWPAVFRVVVRLAHEFGMRYVRLPFDAISLWSGAPFRLARGYYARLTSDYNVRMTDHFLGFRLTGSLTEEAFASAIRALPDGMTEFMCHPGFAGPELLSARTRLKECRLRELEALTSPRIRKLIAESDVRLENFLAE
ncbi:MAG: ChbG/HpnK family deacetylase [Acidobacteriaceae bacterium]|nr:ChbG/HpnK family deacetylase [Acidobacteriaceae bacterium]MBV9780392.1 ChbG/HpnK family deacetylase [Acidobacteriaceae bacterium]